MWNLAENSQFAFTWCEFPLLPTHYAYIWIWSEVLRIYCERNRESRRSEQNERGWDNFLETAIPKSEFWETRLYIRWDKLLLFFGGWCQAETEKMGNIYRSLEPAFVCLSLGGYGGVCVCVLRLFCFWILEHPTMRLLSIPLYVQMWLQLFLPLLNAPSGVLLSRDTR